MTTEVLKIGTYVFRKYVYLNGVISLYLDETDVFESNRHFMVEFKNQEEFNKFIIFLGGFMGIEK